MKSKLLFGLLCTISFTISAQMVVWQEDFEVNGNTVNGGTGNYTSTNDFYDSASDDDYFGRVQGGTEEFFLTDTSSGSIANSFVAYTGYSGSFFYAGEDLDDTGGAIGAPDGDDIKFLTTTVGITGGSNLNFKALFASGNNNGCGSSAYDSTDYIRVSYNVDGAGDVLALQFSPDLECNIPLDVTNEPLYHDPNMDGDGGEGTLLSAAFQEFGFAIPNGTSVVITIEVHMDSGNEEIAFDNLRIESDTVLAIDKDVLSKNVSMYPNPSNGLVELNVANNIELNDASIFNMLGKKVKSFDLQDITNSKTLDLSSLSTGIYMININAKNGDSTTKKLIIK